MNNMLGGPCMNARLSVALRERNGIAYNVESEYTSFADVGLEVIYFGTDADKVNKSISIVMRELKKLRARTMHEGTLKKVKRQIEGQLLMAAEDGESLMLSAARSVIMYGVAEGLQSSVETIHNVKAEDIQRVATNVFNPDEMSVLVYT